jgi:programmed cell death protein 5
VVDEDELERIREKKKEQLEKQAGQQQEVDEARRQQAEAQKKALLRKVLTPEARERLQRVKMARPEKGENIEKQLIQLAASGRIQQKLTDDQLKQILAESQQSRDINIERR